MNAAAVRATSHARWVPAIFGGTWPPILPGATLPVARSLCVHFTTLDGATLSASATFRTLSPAAIRATARSRKSIDRGLTIAAGLQPGQQLESKPGDFGNPRPISAGRPVEINTLINSDFSGRNYRNLKRRGRQRDRHERTLNRLVTNIPRMLGLSGYRDHD